MSAIPQTLEEATASLQKIIDHPTTLIALRREPRLLASFRGSRPHGYISQRLASNYDDSWKLKIIGHVWINMFFVTPLSDGQHVLGIFVETEIEDTKARFGLWNVAEKTMREIKPSEISCDLEKMQYVLGILVSKALGNYKMPDIPQYI